MARLARVVAPGVPHHPPSPFGYGVTGLTQRGNRRQAVFFTDADRRKFLSLPAEQCSSRQGRGENSPAIHRWVLVAETPSVPSGTVEVTE